MTRTTRLFLFFVTLAALTFADSASAMYDPGMGRFLQRDPGYRIQGISAQSVAPPDTFIRRDHQPTEIYNDGMNLYQYVRSHPIRNYLKRRLVARYGLLEGKCRVLR